MMLAESSAWDYGIAIGLLVALVIPVFWAFVRWMLKSLEKLQEARDANLKQVIEQNGKALEMFAVIEKAEIEEHQYFRKAFERNDAQHEKIIEVLGKIVDKLDEKEIPSAKSKAG